MNITIAERLHPFSHTAGVYCLLPGSFYRLQIFPTLIRVDDVSQSIPKPITEIELPFKGPMHDFTVQQDLEKGEVRVWQKTPQGFVRYRIARPQKGPGFGIFFEKAPEHTPIKEWQLYADALPAFEPYIPPQTDRLSLGNHKLQDWDRVQRRCRLEEILPAWYRLGQLTPFKEKVAHQGTALLLDQCEAVLQQKEIEHIVPVFTQLFQAGFQGILSPRLSDDQFQGLAPVSPLSKIASPLSLLTEAVPLIRSFFIKQQDHELTLLPLLPPEFHYGRFIEVPVEGGIIDLEWTKKIIRRLRFFATKDQEIVLHFKKQIKSFRLRKGHKDLGISLSNGSTIKMEKNQFYLIDNFN